MASTSFDDVEREKSFPLKVIGRLEVESKVRDEEEEHEGLNANMTDRRKNSSVSLELPTDQPDPSDRRTNMFSISLAMISGIAISWTLATQFGQSVLKADAQRFYAPLGVIWFKTTFMLLCYPVFLLYTLCAKKRRFVEVHAEAAQIFSPHGITMGSFLRKEVTMCLLWTLANYSFLASIGLISASVATSIMSTNAAMVCVLGWMLLSDTLSWLKFFSCAFAIAGVTVISADQQFIGGDFFGICLALSGALFSALYKVLFKRLNGNASLGQVSLFVSGLGLVNVPLNFAPALALVVTRREIVQWSHIPWAFLIGMAFLAMVFNFLINFGVALLNPLVVTIGMLCGIPLSAAVDIVFRGMPLTVPFFVGSTLIVCSFLLTAIPLERRATTLKRFLLCGICRRPQQARQRACSFSARKSPPSLASPSSLNSDNNNNNARVVRTSLTKHSPSSNENIRHNNRQQRVHDDDDDEGRWTGAGTN